MTGFGRHDRRLALAGAALLLFAAARVSLAESDAASAHTRAAAAMERGDYAVAYCIWRPLAVAGDAGAQYAMGWMYHHGYGLAIDDRAAEAWWDKAVERGHVEAMFSLATLYSLGSDVIPRDLQAAMRLWFQAAAEGHADARLALRQLAARGVPELESLTKQLLADRPDAFGAPREVNAQRVNVRRGPGTGHRIIGVVGSGKRVVELRQQGDWSKIGMSEPARIGWIYSPLLTEVPGPADSGD